MGTNKFLNGEGEVDLTELINEINSLSEEVEGKLDKDGTDGGMTGNLAINDNAIFLGAVGSLDSVGGSTTLFQTDAGGDLALISNRDVILGATNEIRMNDTLNMNGNEINNCGNLISVQNLITLDQEVGSTGGVINSQNLTRVGNAFIGTVEIATAATGTTCGFTLGVPRIDNFVSAALACGTVTVQDGNAPGAYDSKAGGGLNAVVGAKQIKMETNINYQNLGARIISVSFFYLA